MGNFKDEERLKALRERLYSRGKGPEKREPYVLKDEEKKNVSTSWQKPPDAVEDPEVVETPVATPAPGVAPAVTNAPTQPEIAPMAMKKRSRRYRLKILLAGLVFFVLAVGASSMFFLLGGNTISGENIAISLSGPFTVGGGEAIPLQIGVTNENTIPIESATLIVTYPPGTQSASEAGKEVFVERLPLDVVNPGETLNIPLRAIVFGEENEEKTISAEIEYRVQGSNSTFAKSAEPLRFKISSSPIVISVAALHKVSSGQETDIELTISSNAPNTLTDTLIKAEYPLGFDYTTSDPSPVSGQNVWLIESLEPEERKKITITGVIVGRETDEYAMHFSAGVPNEGDRLNLASVFSTVSTEFLIEQPFIDVGLELNGDDSGTVAANAGQLVSVTIVVGNTLDETIYDGRVELSLSGNALTDYEVRPGSGFL